MTRLTNAIRSQIERDVLAELPKQKSLGYYQDLVKKIVEEDGYNSLPMKVKGIWDSAEEKNYIYIGYLYIGSFGFQVAIPGDRMMISRNALKISLSAQSKIDALALEWNGTKTKVAEASTLLRTALYSCQTVKTLRERYPELSKYLPEKVAVTSGTPMVQNALSGFKSLGLMMDSPNE